MNNKDSALVQLHRFKGSFYTLSRREMISLLKRVNEENKYWEAKKDKEIKPVPNMGERSHNANDTHTVTTDNFSEKEFDPIFQEFILFLAHRKRFALHVENSRFGFYPVFAVLEIKRSFISRRPHCLLKLRQHNLSDENHTKFIRILYSKSTKKKLSKIGKEIKELSSYQY